MNDSIGRDLLQLAQNLPNVPIRALSSGIGLGTIRQGSPQQRMGMTQAPLPQPKPAPALPTRLAPKVAVPQTFTAPATRNWLQRVLWRGLSHIADLGVVMITLSTSMIIVDRTMPGDVVLSQWVGLFHLRELAIGIYAFYFGYALFFKLLLNKTLGEWVVYSRWMQRPLFPVHQAMHSKP